MRADKPRVEVYSAPGGAVVVVTLIGDHDLATRPRLMEEIGDLEREIDLVIDLTSCTFIDSTIIGAILNTRLPGRPRVALIPPGDTSYVHRALSVIGLRDLLPLYPSVDAAIAWLTERRHAG
jgi:anti-sigma B factor antagonist